MDEFTQRNKPRTRFASWFAAHWATRAELSIGNIQRANLPGMLLLPLALILADLRFLDQEMTMFGLDSIMLMTLMYSGAWLICMLFPARSLNAVLRVSCLSVAAVLGVILFLPQGELRLLLMLVYHLATGLCIACGFYAFAFQIKNTERFFAVLIISLYYGLIDILWSVDAVRTFLLTPGIILFMAAFLFSVFKTKLRPLPAVEKPRSGHSYGGYIVVVIYLIYFIIDQLNMYIDYDFAFTNDTFTGIGSIVAIGIALLVHLIFVRSSWHLWNLYMLLTVGGLALILWATGYSSTWGSVVYGLASGMGYIAVMYLLGCVGKRHSTMAFFRLICVVSFLNDSVVPLIMDKAYSAFGEYFGVISFGIILVFFFIGSMLVPALYHGIFAAEWAANLHKLDMAQAEAAVNEANILDTFGLTSREKQVTALLLRGMTTRQIAGELGIAADTAKFHTKNLYKKLNIGGRPELFSMLGVHPKEIQIAQQL